MHYDDLYLRRFALTAMIPKLCRLGKSSVLLSLEELKQCAAWPAPVLDDDSCLSCPNVRRDVEVLSVSAGFYSMLSAVGVLA